MLAAAAKLAIAAAVLVTLAPSADAQRVHPRCAHVKDKVKCTCLLANGGRWDRVPGATRYKIYLRTDDNDRYIACMRRSGRPNG